MICLLTPRVIGKSRVPEPPARMIPRTPAAYPCARGWSELLKWVVTGSAGMLGADLVALLQRSGHTVLPLARRDLDIRDPDDCLQAVEGADVVVNTAAWTDVDAAEEAEAQAFSVNAVGAANIAHASGAAGAVLVHVSTDYVFRGDATVPYQVDSPLDPLNAYGRTKAAGEWAVRAANPRAHIVRTAWLYGEHGPSFVRTMLRLGAKTEAGEVHVVDDQRGQPTWTRDLAEYVHSLVLTEPAPRLHHGTSTGECTWFDLAREVFSVAGYDPSRIKPVTSQEHPRPARRPNYSVLANDGSLPDWRDSIRRAVPLMVGVL